MCEIECTLNGNFPEMPGTALNLHCQHIKRAIRQENKKIMSIINFVNWHSFVSCKAFYYILYLYVCPVPVAEKHLLW